MDMTREGCGVFLDSLDTRRDTVPVPVSACGPVSLWNIGRKMCLPLMTKTIHKQIMLRLLRRTSVTTSILAASTAICHCDEQPPQKYRVLVTGFTDWRDMGDIGSRNVQ